MVITAHPDDSEFGAAGSVAKWILKGKRVVYVVCTSGDKGTDNPDIPPQQLAKIREKEQKDAAAVLGVSDLIFLEYPDQGLALYLAQRSSHCRTGNAGCGLSLCPRSAGIS